jgi:DNA-binding LacI/PurR family transcriptional regulator
MLRQVTLQDVATAAGVSMQTVSRVVNHRPDVAEETRLRVWQVIRELGYRPNRLARSLVAQRSHLLGIISLPLNDFFRTQVITATEREVRAHGYACLLSFTEEDLSDLPLLIEQMMERQVDGILLITPKTLDLPLPPFSVPCISAAHPVQDEKVINVDIDNVDGAYQAMAHLIALGHRNIGLLAGPLDWKATQDRLEGARLALAEVGKTLDPSCIEASADWSLDAGYRAAHLLLERLPDLTAFCCHNDWLALGAYRALSERHLRVPEDVSVIGYDDLPVCLYANPCITSVHQPMDGFGELLGQLLVNAIERGNTTPSSMLIKTELVIRESTAPVSHRVVGMGFEEHSVQR